MYKWKSGFHHCYGVADLSEIKGGFEERCSLDVVKNEMYYTNRASISKAWITQ